MATSKIDPSLETPELCIGPSYTLQNKTLQIPNRQSLPKNNETRAAFKKLIFCERALPWILQVRKQQ
jgi:hypothetical protein